MGRGDLQEVLGLEGKHRGRYADDWLRLPGLFRRFEFERVIEVGRELFIEDAGQDNKGMALHRIYLRARRPTPESRNARGEAALLEVGGA